MDDVIKWIENNPQMQAYLKEHARREALPRKACAICQFEYTEEDQHVCKT